MQNSFSHITAALVDTVSSLQGSDGGVIAASEVLNYLLRFMTFCLDSAVSKWVGNTAYLFYSASRQHCEVWADGLPSFPIFTTLLILFLLLKLTLVVASTHIWHKLTNSPH